MSTAVWGEIETSNWPMGRADLGEERIQLELDRLCREHVFKQPILLRQYAKQGQIGVIADSEECKCGDAAFPATASTPKRTPRRSFRSEWGLASRRHRSE